MKNHWFSILAALLLVAGGAALVVVADQRGWLPGATPKETAQGCPHGLVPDQCPFCDKTLIEKMGQCVGHGVPEALCTRCNAALIVAFKAVDDWCGGHNLPESQCTICNPSLLADKSVTPAASSTPSSIQLIPAPELPRSQRPPSPTCQKHTLRVQLRSPAIARSAGLAYARVERREVTQTLACNAEVTFNSNRYARLSSRAPGVVHEVRKDLGEAVAKDEVLAIVDSAELGAAKGEYLQAQALVNLWEKTHARKLRMLESQVGSERDVLEAETERAGARVRLSQAAQRLRNLGLSDAEIERIAGERQTSSFLALTAPFRGTVIERSAVVGEVCDRASLLFVVADTSQMWAMLDVYEADVMKVRIGQPVVLAADGLLGERRGGRISWISSQVDRRTRTLRVRAEIANPDGLLRAGMFGTAIVTVREREAVLVVPKSSVQWEGCCNVVFVKKSDTLFEPRKVRLGYETEAFYVVEEGLTLGEEVVTTGSFLLKTEILKESIGAGCCEVQPGKNE